MAAAQSRRLAAPLPTEAQASASVTDLTPPAHTPKYKRLTDAQRIAILQLAKLDKTQTEIAEIVGCNQSSVSDWLRQTADTTAEASTYLKGRALSMARQVVSRGKPADHISVLKGVGVLQDVAAQGLSIHIGGNNTDVKILTLSGTTDRDASS